MNAIIQEIAQRGLSQDMYSIICTAGTVISLCYSLWHAWKMGVRFWKVCIIFPVVYLGMSLIQSGIYKVLLYIQRNHVFGIQTTVNSIVRVFVFLPLIGFVLAKILKLKWSLVCDAIAMFPFLMSGINQLACLFTGCCEGYPVAWGVYSIQTGNYHFPTPIVETILTLILFVVLIIRTRKKQYISDGTLYPLMMILYGVMRFICEALRENEKIILGCSAMAIHAIFMCIVGVIVLRIIDQKQQKKVQES